MDGNRDYYILKNLSKSARQISHVWNLKYDTNGLIYKSKIDSQT